MSKHYWILILIVGVYAAICLWSQNHVVPFHYWIWPGLFLLVMLVTGSFAIRLNYFGKWLHRSNNGEKIVALTFDDGPHPKYTGEVLKLLNKYEVKATFFMIGQHIAEHRSLAKQVHSEGHQISNHSFSHSNNTGFFGTSRVMKEIQLTNDAIAELGAGNNSLYRPPFGVTNPNIARAVKKLGMDIIGWSNRSFDTAAQNPETVVKRITKNLSPGDIILLHDSHNLIIPILERLLPYLEGKGFRFVTINQMFNFNQDA